MTYFIRIFAGMNSSRSIPLKKILLIFLFLLTSNCFSQTPELSPLSKVSVLTSGPGTELYSAFGHSAIRVQDPALGIDVVYNYGVFDTESENFYLKFAQGRMYYLLVRQGFQNYLRSYEIENRWVKEQVLNVSLAQKKKLFRFLEHNNLPENKQYQYDYFLNNCSTKIWDVLQENLSDHLVFDATFIKTPFSFRELIHQNIKTNSWGAFGIDLALGSVIDRKASPKEHLYLPSYVMRQLRVAKINGGPAVTKETSLLESTRIVDSSGFMWSPLFFSILVSLLIIGSTFLDVKKQRPNRGLDVVLFVLTGVAGSLLIFLWFFTDHIWTVGNYNILWAFPLNVAIVYFVSRKTRPSWISKYAVLLLLLLLVMVGLSLFNVQYFSPVLLPFLFALAIRYYYIIHSSRSNKKYQ